ncbi:hypothetical protein [Paraburkholderia largidicola]|uniref:hypothetical protein n=1 Tax=Paraburkholderia largidicola TaxID=3014751 RepID=UPI0015DA82BE|nr:hypothetical protein [Paraburkholderia sp. PGU16]
MVVLLIEKVRSRQQKYLHPRRAVGMASNSGLGKTKRTGELGRLLLAEGMAACRALEVVEHVRVDLLAYGGTSGTTRCAPEQRAHERTSKAAED